MYYTITIDEAQRKALIHALLIAHDRKCAAFDETHKDEPHSLREMLEQLPQDESETPGCTHGLCL